MPAESPSAAAPDIPEVVAIIQTFNEDLILEATLRHLTAQGIGVHLTDDGSTDRTVEIARSFLGRGMIAVESSINTNGPGEYDHPRVLQRKAQIAHALAQRGGKWMIHYDADEIREPPWPGVSLRDGLRRAAAEGFNLVDHVVVDFVPTDEHYVPGIALDAHFRHYLPRERPLRQGKAWIQGPALVDLQTHAGHFVKFPGRKVYPIPFIIKHYPILSTAHGKRKVLLERKPRYSQDGRARGWHKHYDHIRDDSHMFVHAPDDPRLRLYDDQAFKQELLSRAPANRVGIISRLFQRNDQ